MRAAWLISIGVFGLLAFQSPVAAQTMVEYGAAAGAAGTAAAAAAKGIGASLGGVLNTAGKALKPAEDPVHSVEPAAKARPAASKPKAEAEAVKDSGEPAATAPVAKPSYEDAVGIQKGMACEEMTRRFGPPAMSFASEEDAQTMSYSSKSGGVQVECRGGKVASVEKPG